MTSICLPGIDGGLAEWGSKTVPEMISLAREKARHDKVAAEAVLAASDGEFLVETFLGKYARRNLEVLQGSSRRCEK